MDTVERLCKKNQVVIFIKSSCRYMSHTPETLIRDYGANPVVHELEEFSDKQQIERFLNQLGAKPSEPAVFIGGNWVGGTKEVISLKVNGDQLKQLLLDARAIWF